MVRSEIIKKSKNSIGNKGDGYIKYKKQIVK